VTEPQLQDIEDMPDRLWVERRFLVAGGGGFIGRAVVRALLDLGARDVTVVGRRAAGPSHCQTLAFDLRDRAAVTRALVGARYDVVVNAVGTIDQSTLPTIYEDLFEANFLTALNLVQGLRGASVGRFVHIGSNAEYGAAPCPHGVITREEPQSAYGILKLAATRMVLAEAAATGLPACVIRPFLVYGAGQSPRAFLSLAAAAAAAGAELPATVCEQTRDFIAAGRVARDVLRATVGPFSPGEIRNSCTGVEIRLSEVLAFLKARFLGFRPRLGALPYRRGEMMRSVGVPTRPIAPETARGELFTFLEEQAAAHCARPALAG
jgi:nucleoside-diphosphate-sugar epimerase